MGIVSIEEVLWYGDIKAERVDGLRMQDLIDAAEAFVQRYTRRKFAPEPELAANGSDTNAPVTKTFAVPLGRRIVRIPDLRAPTTVMLNNSTLKEGFSYQLMDVTWEPATSIDIIYPYGSASAIGSYVTVPNPYAHGTLSITGRWGWNPVPPDVKDAVRALAIRAYRERDAAWADSVALPDGSVLSYFRTMPARVQGQLQQYKVPNIALI